MFCSQAVEWLLIDSTAWPFLIEESKETIECDCTKTVL